MPWTVDSTTFRAAPTGPWQTPLGAALAVAEAQPAMAVDAWAPSAELDVDPSEYHVSQYPGATNTQERTRNNGNCGPVCTLMALKAFGRLDPTPAEVNAVVAEIRRRGGAPREERVGHGSATATHHLARAARAYGLEAVEGDGQKLADVEAALAAGKLVIVLVRPGAYTRSSSTGHYVLVTGMRDGKVIVNDPAQQTSCREIDATLFARAMALKGGLTVTLGEPAAPAT
ncbi:MAG: C39 family peptidase [Candidatus Sericytochromatia bacterium]|nr:C39 family peptidase [Candidatus Sericytochromatia bacterium]